MSLLSFVSLSDQISPLKLLVLFVALVAIVLAAQTRSVRSDLPLPPSPPGDFILGNLRHILPAIRIRQQHLLFGRWAREYGEIFRVRSPGLTQYFINSDEAIKQLFDRDSAFTSHRPRWIASNEQICNKMNVLLLSGSDPRWKHQRKITHTYLTSIPRADAGLPWLHYESAKFLSQMVQEADITEISGWKLYRRILRYTYSTFTSQTFGMDVPDDDDSVIFDIHETGLAQILGTLPGESLIDSFPVLDRLPLWLKPWERRNRARFERDMRFVREKLQRIQEARKQGDVSNAFLPLIDVENKGPEFAGGIDEAAYLSLMLVIGAADTSAVSTWSFMQAMLMFPEVQEKARKEITSVVLDRMPVFEDMENIPYVRCLLKETWRWRPPVALGHPHITTKDLTYKGMHIPKGAQIHLNAWAVHHDPQRYHNPDQFIPERFESDHTDSMQSINAKDVSKRDHFVFGAGRRVCPGYHVAERSLAVAIMRILWAFKIVPSANAKLPLDHLSFEGEMMPAIADKRMPVSFALVSSSRKRHIEKAFDEISISRPKLAPLVVRDTGVGAFERLWFLKTDTK